MSRLGCLPPPTAAAGGRRLTVTALQWGSMISPLPGWSWAARQGGITLIPPEGPACGAIRYHERQRPLLRLSAFVQHKDTDPNFHIVSMSRPEQLITDEGEYAAILHIEGLLSGAPVRRSMGFVFGDDYYASIAGLALQPAHFDRMAEAVRTLVLTDRHMLGVRRRRYLFTPPHGWNGLERLPLCAYYYPADYPENATVLCVYPAIPREGIGEEWVLSNLQPIDGPKVARVTTRQSTVSGQLSGSSLSCVCAGEVESFRDIVLLSDDRYLYPLSIDAPGSRLAVAREQLAAVVQSLQPIPRSVTERKSTAKALSFWV